MQPILKRTKPQYFLNPFFTISAKPITTTGSHEAHGNLGITATDNFIPILLPFESRTCLQTLHTARTNHPRKRRNRCLSSSELGTYILVYRNTIAARFSGAHSLRKTMRLYSNVMLYDSCGGAELVSDSTIQGFCGDIIRNSMN